MNKEEILKMSRMESQNEMENHIRDKSFFISTITLIIVAEVLAYIRMLKGQPVWDLCLTEWAAITAGFLYRFIMIKSKLLLFVVICSLIMLAISFFCMIKGIIIF